MCEQIHAKHDLTLALKESQLTGAVFNRTEKDYRKRRKWKDSFKKSRRSGQKSAVKESVSKVRIDAVFSIMKGRGGHSDGLLQAKVLFGSRLY